MRSLLVLGLSLCLLFPAPGSAQAVQDVTGRWALDVDLGDAGAGTAIFEFKQEGEKITGTYSGALGEEAVTGKITGDQVEFSFGSQAGTVTYKGKVSGTTMEGTCEYGQLGGGTFKGSKREAGPRRH